MCEATLIMMAASTVLSAGAQYQQGQVAKQVGRNNQIMAEYAAQDALRRGEEDAQKVRQQADQLKGRQRALMAAKGLDLTEGTPADILDQTDFFGQTDIATMSAFGTLLGSGGQVADKWYSRRTVGAPGDGLSQGDRRKLGVY
jgi:hypothetical protein